KLFRSSDVSVTRYLIFIHFTLLQYSRFGDEKQSLIRNFKLYITLEYYGTLYAISDLGLPFFNCHRSIVVNVNHIKSVDSVRREAKMTDGTIIPVAKRKMAEVLKNI
ncbi:MAG: LytTR family transcriptional regulator, partial [Oscillospiraceae bacterium]|nr:LytTR family transcriptional regulator [Oscillospiraceae bacterium]